MSQVPHLLDRSDISNFLVGLLSGFSEHLQKSSRAISKISLELKILFLFSSLMEKGLFSLCV